MANKLKTNAGNIIALLMTLYAVYYLLLSHNCLHCDIASIIAHSNHMADKTHMVVLGLLPIYIATMIFGAAMLGLALGSTLQQFLVRSFRYKRNESFH